MIRFKRKFSIFFKPVTGIKRNFYCLGYLIFSYYNEILFFFCKETSLQNFLNIGINTLLLRRFAKLKKLCTKCLSLLATNIFLYTNSRAQDIAIIINSPCREIILLNNFLFVSFEGPRSRISYTKWYTDF